MLLLPFIPEIRSGNRHRVSRQADIEYSEIQRMNMYKRVATSLALELEPLKPTELRSSISPERIAYAFHLSALVQTTSALLVLLVIIAEEDTNGDEDGEEEEEGEGGDERLKKLGSHLAEFMEEKHWHGLKRLSIVFKSKIRKIFWHVRSM